MDNGIIRHSRRGIVDKNGNPTGYITTTKNRRRYIEDKYVDMAHRLMYT